MKKIPATLMCGIAVMVLTVILYFTILGTGLLAAIHYIALLGILLAEGITTAYACAAGGGPRRVAAAVASGLMIPVSVILSVVYLAQFAANIAKFGQQVSADGSVVYFSVGYGSYIGWYLAGTLIVNVLAFILLRFDAGKNEENSSLQDAKNNMLALRKLVMSIVADPAAKDYAKRLRALEEKLHFSNDTVIDPEDENIYRLLLQLRENIADPEFDSEQLLSKIEKTVEVRGIMTSRTV